jgi:hypothetical protein
VSSGTEKFVDVEITLWVDSREHRLVVDTRTTLLDALRERLGITSPKKGCDHGQCGAYTVIEAYWVDEDDPYVNPMGAKGVGEIGIVGTAAAIANAAHHATGVRVRDLPITLEKVPQ